MQVELNFTLPEGVDNPHVIDWMVVHHKESIIQKWDVVPNVGETVDMLTENGSEIIGKVKERVWIPTLCKEFGAHADVCVKIEVLNFDDITEPLY